MQIMPATQAEIQLQLGVVCNWYSPKCSILMGAYYDKRQYDYYWRHNRTWQQRLDLMLAAYNCGAGCVDRAQERCGALNVPELVPCLPHETRGYLDKIHGYFNG